MRSYILYEMKIVLYVRERKKVDYSSVRIRECRRPFIR